MVLTTPQLIQKSIERTKALLFRPFELKRWLAFLMIAWLAGALSMGSGGGSGGGGRAKQETSNTQATVQRDTLAAGQDAAAPAAPSEDSRSNTSSTKTGTIVLIGIGIFFAILPFYLIFTWLASRFKFVWLQAIVHNQPSVWGPFKEYAKEGNSLFRFFILIQLSLVVLFVLPLGLWIYSLYQSGIFQEMSRFPWMTFIWLVPFFILGGLFYLALTTFVEDFVVPIMAAERSPFSAAWKKFKEIYKSHGKRLWIYFLVKSLLSILTGILAMILALIGILVFLLAGLLIFGLLYLLLITLLKAKIIFYIIGGLLGIPFLAAAALAIVSSGLPFAVFFRNFSLYYLSNLQAGYQPLALEV